MQQMRMIISNGDERMISIRDYPEFLAFVTEIYSRYRWSVDYLVNLISAY
jgi:hypothetical protein